MSLLLHKRAISRAVLGELSGDDEARLRAHLGRCARCRDHYDALARVAGGLGGGAAAAAGRERARLFAALDAPARAAAPVRAASARRPWLAGGLALASAAAIILVVARPRPAPPPATDDGVTLRGGGEPAARAPAATLVVYASRKTGPSTHGALRLAGELPGSGEARVSLADYLQLGVRGLRAPAHVRVVGVDGAGAVHDYVRDATVAPGAPVAPVGGSVELAREHAPGRLRVIALFSQTKLDEATARAAIARAARTPDEPGPGAVTGLLVIEP